MIEVAVVLLRQYGQYVLQQRDNLPHIADAGMVSIWGGKVEEGDASPADAALREVFEETGVKLDPSSLVHLESYDTNGKSATNYDKQVLAHLYFAEVDKSVTIQCYEGEALVRVKKLDEIPPEKQSEFLKRSIALYEQ